MDRGQLLYELAKTAVSVAAVIFLGVALVTSLRTGVDGEIRMALIAGLAGLGGFPLPEALRGAGRQLREYRRVRNGGR